MMAAEILVEGRVQGVGFRTYAQRKASLLGLSGYVRNLRDGRVEVYAIGKAEQLRALRVELERGPRAAHVEGVAEEDAPVEQRYAREFSVEFDRW